jgi:cell division protein FtsL
VNELVHADIFFVITSVAVILLTGALLCVLWHVFRLARTLRNLAEKIEAEAGEYLKVSEEVRERFEDHPIVRMLIGAKKQKHARSIKRD